MLSIRRCESAGATKVNLLLSDSQAEPSTLVELLRLRAHHQPEGLAFSFVFDGEKETVSLSYDGLDRRARVIGAWLQGRGAAGERVVLLFPPGLDVIAAFFGCLYAGAVAVLAAPPRPRRSMYRLEGILTDARAKFCLTTAAVRSSIVGAVNAPEGRDGLTWLVDDQVPAGIEAEWREPAISSATLAFLQYTSGSTTTPRGVMVSHGNLLHNLALIRHGFQIPTSSRGVFWLPMYHDMGLIGGVLQPIYVGKPSVLMAPASFLQRPVRWLQAVSDHRATVSGAPNFAYDICVDRISSEERASLDLSCWDLAFCGAEPICWDTLERFTAAFAPSGFRPEAFYPCYGLAEATLMVSGGAGPSRPRGFKVQTKPLREGRVVWARPDEDRTQTLVSSGHALLDQKVAIVNPETLTPCPTDQVGEVWVSGPSVALGYWDRPEETARTFHARIAGTADGPYLRTGDLGFLAAGELVVTGRLKDLIIIHGCNHYPHDIEQTVERCHPALLAGCGAAFSVERDCQDRLVIVQEVERQHRNLDGAEVIALIRKAVADEHELPVDAVVLVKPLSIPKTSSGKIQRYACREKYLAGSLEPVAEWRAPAAEPTETGGVPALAGSSALRTTPTAPSVEAWLVARIAAQIGIDPGQIDRREPLAHYGINSVQAVSLSGDLEQWLGRPLSATLIYDYPTIESLSRYLGEGGVVKEEAEAVDAHADRPADQEPIAVIGLGCRFPGGAGDVESYWRLLRDGVDAVSRVTGERWDPDRFYYPVPATPGKMNTCFHGFLEGVDLFDPHFFGISPREAARMDPQQRLLLEVSWEAFEHAGLVPGLLAGSRNGVFIGISNNDYSRFQGSDPTLIDAYAGTGNAFSIAANRLSYFFDFRGPSLAVDTACSSSLVAVHLACQSLRHGECDLALAGGVNLILAPELTISLSQARMMASDGRCKTFDAAADGYVRSEGCGVVVLKRLSDAVRDGDTIHALLKGTAVNHDGRSNGLTAPNGPSQQAVIRQALDDAGTTPEQISYVEVHGTGTALGDPIEFDSLRAVMGMGNGRPNGETCALGSVKTNVGHLEAAAGIASLIKVVLSLGHGEIPPHLHIKTLNPDIDLRGTPFVIPTQRLTWAPGSRRRQAGVSSFGFGGTNTHVIVEEAPPPPPAGTGRRPAHVLTLSASTQTALDALTGRYATFLASHPEVSLADVCFTANTGRTQFVQRLAVVADHVDQLRQRLLALVSGQTAPGTARGCVPPEAAPGVVFLFTGQGSLKPGTGRRLFETQAAFREALERCDLILRALLERPLLEVLYPGPGVATPLNETGYAPAALFALEYALTELWRSWGIVPAAVIGHSLGEYVAACVAGAFSLEDGLELVVERSRLIRTLPREGAMAAVFGAPERVAHALANQEPAVSIAAFNGPEHLVISGLRSAVAMVLDRLRFEGIGAQWLDVSHAYHSPLMHPILDKFERWGASRAFGALRLPLVTNLSGELMEPGTVLDAHHWRDHLREPVQFTRGLKTLAEQGYSLFLEVGPNPTLLGLAKVCLGHDAGVWLPSLKEGQDDVQVLLNSLATLFVRGVLVDWEGFERGDPRRRVPLPTYPFQRQRCWFETQQRPLSIPTQPLHPLLGTQQELASGELVCTQQFNCSEQPWLSDHRVFERVVAPATLYLTMALAISDLPCRLVEVSIEQTMVLEEHDQTGRQVQLVLAPADENGQRTFRLFSKSVSQPNGWTRHVRGRIEPWATTESETAAGEPLGALWGRLQERSVEAFYEAVTAVGVAYGASFRGLSALWAGDGEALGEVRLPEELANNGLDLHPAHLDACIQVAAVAVGVGQRSEGTFFPFQLERLELAEAVPAHIYCHARLRTAAEQEAPTLTADLWLLDEASRLLGRVGGLVLKRAGREALLSGPQTKVEDWLYEVRWHEQPHTSQVIAADFFPPVSALADRVQPVANRLARDAGLDVGVGRLAVGLEELSRQYIVRALKRLGWSAGVGAVLDANDLLSRLKILPAHRRLVGRMLEILAGGGLLQRDGSLWRVVRELPVDDPKWLHQELLKRYPHAKVELTLVGRCGQQLDGVLAGKLDPLCLLLPREGVSAEDLYRDATGARVFNSLVCQSIQEALAALPPGRHLRVLEVGAGIGGTTSSVLPVLPAGQTEYHYTDLSAAFFDAAATRFSQYPFLEYRVLDIERDPAGQGFGRHRCDLILAANVLHATRNIKETVVHVRQLLAPGGLLVLLEGLERQAWLDLTFGLLEGWWRFEDALRPDYALLNLEQWSDLLQSQGFTEPAALAPEGLTQQAVILARGPAEVDLPQQRAGSWLILADRQGLGAGLAEGLGRQGQSCVLVEPAERYAALGPDRYQVPVQDPGGWERLLVEAVPAEPPLRGVVHLWGLDAAPTDAITPATLVRDTRDSCGSALTLVQALLRNDRRPDGGLWLVTSGAQVTGPERGASLAQSPLWGLGKVVALEHPELACRLVDLDASGPQKQVELLMAELLVPSAEDQVALRDRRRLVPRLVHSRQVGDRLARPEEDDFRLEKGTDRTLEGLHFTSGSLLPPAAGEVQVEVHAAGLNFHDVLVALGVLDALGIDEGPLGSELSGRVVAVGAGVAEFGVGDEVVGLATGVFARRVNIPAILLAHKPERLSHVEAATVPVAFTTARLAFQLADVQAGDRVLIHAASGGVGLAAVQLAQSKGAEVFATASEPKQAYLRSLGVQRVYNSRSTDFARQVLADTGGAGVDVVLNSLTGAGFVEATLSALCQGGRFVEIGKLDIWPAERVSQARPDVAYHIVALDVLTPREPQRIGALFREIADALEHNRVQPLPRTVYHLSEAPAAFRHMQQARHVGKIVLTVSPSPVFLRPEGTFLITGGLGALGLRAAEWLAQQGAKHLVLIGRHAPDGEAEAALDRLRQSGAQVRVMLGDVSREEDVRRILRQIDEAMPPLAGVIHSAGVLRDGVLLNQSWERFEEVLAPKVLGAWHLHRLTAGRDLRLFVLFSSIVSVLGNRGQVNHAAANAFLDQLAWERRAQGLPGFSINWGAWSEIGAAARARGGLERLASQGVESLTPDQGIEVLGQLLSRDITEIAVANIRWPQFFKAWPAAEALPLLSALASELADEPVQGSSATGGGSAVRETLQSVAPEQRAELIEAYLRKIAAKVLGLGASSLDPHQPLVNLGLDSLMAIELRNRIEVDLGVRVPMVEFLKGPSVAQLVGLLLDQVAESSVSMLAPRREREPAAETEWEVVTL